MKINTKCVQSGYTPKNGEPRVLPLYQSTTYVYDTPEQLANIFDLSDPGFMYTRLGNPTSAALETKIADLEGGSGALACSSGLAAETLAILNVCKAGDNIISLSTIYGGSYNLFNVTLKRYGIEARFVAPDATEKEIESKIDDNTKIIYCESIANPSMNISDFDILSKVAKKYGILFMVDNTLTTPIICKPKEYGANIIVHSTTKYMDGHASCVGGIIVECGNFDFKGNPRYKEMNEPDASYHGLIYADCGNTGYILKARAQGMRDLGCCISPFNAYLTNLGIETLHLRMERHSQNGQACAEALKNHKNIEWIKYSGLKGDANFQLAQKYFDGLNGGMVVFGVKGGREAANKFMKGLKLIKIVTHIADTRSCVLHPATTTHRQLSDSDLIACGISDNLIRLSVGIEDSEDIIADLINALNNI